MTDIRLDRFEFRAWLDEKAQGERVGLRNTSSYCPLAEYLKESEVGWPSVDARAIILSAHAGGPERCAPPSRWVQDFITYIDGSGPLGTGVQARTALRILDSIP